MKDAPSPQTTFLGRLARRPTAVAALLIFAATLAAYGTVLRNGFRFDDETLILANDLLHEPRALPQLLRLPILQYYYRPLVTLSFFLDYRLWGASGAGFHLTNLLLHFANALLVFFFIRLLFGNHRLATFTAVLFAVHPVQAVALNYVADRGNLLVTLFTLSGLIFFLQSLRRPLKTRGPALLSGLFFGAALFSRENAILFPLLAAASLLALRKDNDRRGRLLVASYFFVALGFLALRQALFPFSSVVVPDNPLLYTWQGVTAFSYMVFLYLKGMFLPGSIHMIREFQVPAWGGAEMFLFPLLLAGLVTFCLTRIRRRGPAFFGLAWFLITTLPLYGFLFSRPLIGFFIQDNQMYLGSLGLLLLLAMGLDRAARSTKIPLGLMLAFLLCSFYASRAVSFNRLYHDEEAFLKEWVRLSPHSDLAAFYLGSYYKKHGETERAVIFYQRSMTGSILDAKAHNNIGAIAFDKGEYRLARGQYRQALAINPSLREALYGLGCVALREGDVAQGEQYLLKAAASAPDWPLPRLDLVKLRTIQGRLEEALGTAEEIKKQFPSVEETYYLIVWLHLARHEVPQALAVAEELLPRAADISQACEDLAGLFEQAGHIPLAESIREASQMKKPAR